MKVRTFEIHHPEHTIKSGPKKGEVVPARVQIREVVWVEFRRDGQPICAYPKQKGGRRTKEQCEEQMILFLLHFRLGALSDQFRAMEFGKPARFEIFVDDHADFFFGKDIHEMIESEGFIDEDAAPDDALYGVTVRAVWWCEVGNVRER